jgi:hypothetical protein
MIQGFWVVVMLSDAAMEQVQGLVNNFSAMAPGQVRPHLRLAFWRLWLYVG